VSEDDWLTVVVDLAAAFERAAQVGLRVLRSSEEVRRTRVVCPVCAAVLSVHSSTRWPALAVDYVDEFVDRHAGHAGLPCRAPAEET
jgi:hypothetical protein